MFEVKDNLTHMEPIANKAEIKIANHRDDGDLRALRLKENDGKAKMFDLKTFAELCITNNIRNCDICIAEDFFWTGMPLMRDCQFVADEDHDVIGEAVVASSWGTPAIISNDNGKMYACYKEIDMDDFPGVYLEDWDKNLFHTELDSMNDFLDGILVALNAK